VRGTADQRPAALPCRGTYRSLALVDRPRVVDEQLGGLANHLAARRGAILEAWRKSVEADPEISTANSLPRRQFVDHIPAVLDALEERLRSLPQAESTLARRARKEDSAVHGRVRWQQGYDLREVTREWGHLGLCLGDELESYAKAHSELEPQVMLLARRALGETWSDGASESTAQYFELQQIEAQGQLRDLEGLVAQAAELERERAELWRQAAHDLRGNVGVVATVSAGLTLDGLPEPVRGRFTQSLQRSVSALQSMLDEVTILARLQAGQEQRADQPFDVAELANGLCEALRGTADRNGLFLKVEGPSSLPVEGDRGKVSRIAQNLILNALKYTQQGGVTVSWGDGDRGDTDRWKLCVQDTGPGFHAGPGAPLAGALEEATEEAKQVEAPSEPVPVSAPPHRDPKPSDARPVNQERGEGVGLSIVKRLCELLDAAFAIRSEPGHGTTVTVFFPRRYPDPTEPVA
jgi:signal transduction histidine kinase